MIKSTYTEDSSNDSWGLKDLVHPSLRGVSSGVYHLIKRDITEVQCQWMMIGLIRLAGAVAGLATIALTYYTTPQTAAFKILQGRMSVAILSVWSITFLADFLTNTLFVEIAVGLPRAYDCLPKAVNIFASGIFAKGCKDILITSIFLFPHISHHAVPKLYPTNLLRHTIINKGQRLGSCFFQWLKAKA